MPITLGEYIRHLRKKNRMTLRALAKLSGVSDSELSRIETGFRQMPSPLVLKKIAPHLGVMTENLLEKSGYLKPETSASLPRTAAERCPALAQAIQALDTLSEEQLKEIACFLDIFVEKYKNNRQTKKEPF